MVNVARNAYQIIHGIEINRSILAVLKVPPIWQGAAMYADRPNHNMCALCDAAIAMANDKSRLAAVEFLFKQGCTPDSIALILAPCSIVQVHVGQTSPRL